MAWIQVVQKNRVFRFLSSVKLAVPLMFALLVSAAAGTVYESQYNAEIATVRVYRSAWFLTLLGLLLINIFSATVSRWPFKKHHTGFVITHIGLLTLLIGGMMTATIGIDGQLRVAQGGSDNEVFFLQRMVVRVDGDYEAAVAECRRQAEANGWTIISDTSWPGYEQTPRDVMRGYTVLAEEVLRQWPQGPTHVFVQAGVGGLASAVIGHLWARCSKRPPIYRVNPVGRTLTGGSSVGPRENPVKLIGAGTGGLPGEVLGPPGNASVETMA